MGQKDNLSIMYLNMIPTRSGFALGAIRGYGTGKDYFKTH